MTIDCQPAQVCVGGGSVLFTIFPGASCPPGLPGPGGCTTPYHIQACDHVTWNFGDGTTATVTGQETITHAYAGTGTFEPTATISNSLGSAQVNASRVTISANPPAYVEFAQAQVIAPETAGHVTFTFVRSGNLSVSSTVHWAHAETYNGVVNQADASGGDVTFAPGETSKSLPLRIYDDHLYTGPDVSDTVLATATDGTLFGIAGVPTSSATARYTLTEVDPQPTANVADVRVLESSGTADIVVTLSAPIGLPVAILGTPDDVTAKFGSDYTGPDYKFTWCEIDPGNTQCVMHIALVDDAVPEPDETFTLTIGNYGGARVAPAFGRRIATVTIVNDDGAITPASMQIATGARVSLKLDIGQPPAAPLTIPLQSSSPEVLEVPASVTVEAGQSTANIAAHALQAGRSRITASIPGMTAPPALITVVDAVTIVADPAAVALRPGGDAAVDLSIQPPRNAAQTVSVWSTRPDVASAPESLTIPAGGKATLKIHALASGVATIWIVTADGFSFSVDVTVADGAVLTRVEPSSAPAGGGSSVTLMGEGLDAHCSVSFGSTPAAAVSAVSGGLSVVVPAHPPGVVDVTVVCGTARITLSNAFTFFVPRRRAAG